MHGKLLSYRVRIVFLAKSFHINFPVGSVIKKNSLKVKLFFAFTFESYLKRKEHLKNIETLFSKLLNIIGYHMLLHSKLYFVFCLIKFYKVNKKIKNIRFNDFLRYIVFICKMLYCYNLKEFLQNILYKQF